MGDYYSYLINLIKDMSFSYVGIFLLIKGVKLDSDGCITIKIFF